MRAMVTKFGQENQWEIPIKFRLVLTLMLMPSRQYHMTMIKHDDKIGKRHGLNLDYFERY